MMSQTYGSQGASGNATRNVIFAVVAVVVVAALFLVAKAARTEKLEAPKTFVAFTSADKSFTCDAPGGWDVTSVGVEGSENGGALFKKGGAKIDFTTSQSLSAFADIANATNAQQQQLQGDLQSMPGNSGMQNLPTPPPPVPAVEQIHKMRAKAMAENYADYSEQPMQKFTGRMGEGRFSEWTAKGGIMTGKLHGYRVTLVGKDKSILLVCRCPETNWATLKPAFQRVITSVAPGPG